jgi:diadenosine tetraphosphatase ApaH/serine/threonine PP2A family protein phosphatase
MAVFGNYEVSGWRRLKDNYRTWVRGWPPLLAGDDYLAAHAVPWRPKGVDNVQEFGAWLRKTGLSWRALFPYMNEADEHLWRTLAELEDQGKTVMFHGHTHRQVIWCWEPSGRLRQLPTSRIDLEPGHRYVVGVGSVGLPQDNCWASYALYDSDAGRIELIQLGLPGE